MVLGVGLGVIFVVNWSPKYRTLPSVVSVRKSVMFETPRAVEIACRDDLLQEAVHRAGFGPEMADVRCGIPIRAVRGGVEDVSRGVVVEDC